MSDYNTNNKTIKDKILNNLNFTPTQDQVTVATHLSAFTKSTKHNPVYVLKGYAGTGKTSMISAYVNTLKQSGGYFVLLAPTGRAAKVLAQYTSFHAHTVHRYIYIFMTNKDGVTNIVLSPNKLRNAVFIVDESSMIGDNSQTNNSIFSRNSLLDDLIQYVFSQKGNKLVLVGDTAQLPPVGINLSPALDIENLRNSYSITSFDFEMKEVMRQSLDSGILTSATKLRKKIEDKDINPPFYKLNEESGDITLINDASTFGDLLMESFTDSDSDNGIIVCRSNKQANLYNTQIRNRILMRESEIETGDLLMVVKNNYFWLDKDSRAGFIANGDIVKITRFKNIEDVYGFHFADVDIKMVDYPDEKEFNVKLLLDTISTNAPGLSEKDNKRLFNSVEEDYSNYSNRRTRLNKIKANVYFNALHVKFSYAMTCHKTQGGQWKNVFIDKGYITEDNLDTEYLRWLYTATTRATEKLNLVGFDASYFEVQETE
jgi:ATP-dependent exoDNAse (exonuclease V) alpha subunit